MTEDQTTWDKIYDSLVEDKNNGLSYDRGIVNYDNLTNHLDTLYFKISELEARLDRQDKYTLM